MLTKEKCENALINLCSSNSKVQDRHVFKDLIEEHFYNPPLKFEELKVGMWVWDNEHDMFNQILELRINCAEEQEIEFNYSLETDDEIYNDIWEENRFYRKQVEDDV